MNKIKLTLESHEMNEHQKTDILLVENKPLITLTESKMSNLWYHEHLPFLFRLTPQGFIIEPFHSCGKKEVLIRHGFGR